MSKLENLVPPVDLCKLIPAGEFEDAAFAWVLSDVVGFVCRTSGCEQVSGKQWQLTRSNASRIIRARKRGEQIFPAPTLQEILAQLNESEVWHVNASLHFCKKDRKYKYPSDDALKIWLVWKGIWKIEDLK